jgi:hypothetical protein
MTKKHEDPLKKLDLEGDDSIEAGIRELSSTGRHTDIVSTIRKEQANGS